MRRIFFFLLFSWVPYLTSFASAPLTLVELVDIALKNNPETAIAWGNAKRAQAALGIAQSANYPILDAKGTLDHAREVKFPNGPNTVFTSYGGEISLSYLLFDFGERKANVQAAKEALIAAHWSTEFSIQRIIYTVASNYYEYLSATAVWESKNTALQEAQKIYDAAAELHKAGLRTSTDLTTSKAALAQIQIELAQQSAQVAIAYGKLLTSLGVPIEEKMTVQTDPDGLNDPSFSEGVSLLIDKANKQRSDLLAKQATLKEMDAKVDRAKKASWPKLRGLGQGGWLEYSKHQGNGYNYIVGLALEIPVFKGFEYTYQRRLACADAEITAAELKELQNDIALEVLTYSESVKAAQKALEWSEEYVNQALQSYEGSMESYKAGLQNIFDLIQSQRALADARIKRAQTKTQWLVSLAQLGFATGSLSLPEEK
jgi:outer membrane protein